VTATRLRLFSARLEAPTVQWLRHKCPEDGREHRKRAAVDAVALQEVSIDSTVEGVPPYIVCRIIRAFYAGYPRFPSSRNARSERVDFDIDSVARSKCPQSTPASARKAVRNLFAWWYRNDLNRFALSFTRTSGGLTGIRNFTIATSGR
jgi:hypothetical protein